VAWVVAQENQPAVARIPVTSEADEARYSMMLFQQVSGKDRR
jgi:hypothetical protein